MANATCQARAVLPVPRPTPSNTRFPVMTLTNTLPSARKPIASSDPVPIARATVRMFRTAAARRQRSANALNAAMAAELAGHRRRAALTEPGVVTLAARMRAAVPAEGGAAPRPALAGRDVMAGTSRAPAADRVARAGPAEYSRTAAVAGSQGRPAGRTRQSASLRLPRARGCLPRRAPQGRCAWQCTHRTGTRPPGHAADLR